MQTLTYQWYRNTENNNTTGTAIDGATSARYSPPTTEVGVLYYYVVVTNTDTRPQITGNQVATATSNVATVTVNEILYFNDIASAADVSDWTLSGVTYQQTANNGVTTGQLVFTTFGSSATSPAILPPNSTDLKITISARYGNYIFLQTSVDGTTWVPATNTTDASGNLFTGSMSIADATRDMPDGTRFVRFTGRLGSGTVIDVYLISIIITGTAGTGGDIINAQTPNITAHPHGATYTQSATATPLTVTANVTDGGQLSYQWYSNTVYNSATGTAIGEATNANFTPPTADVGTLYYYVIVTNTNTSVNGTQTATKTSNIATVEVTAESTNIVGANNYLPLQVYPNPVNDELRITIDELRIGEMIELFDMNGRRVFFTRVGAHPRVCPRQPLSQSPAMGEHEGSPLRGDTITIDMTPFQPGNYILRIGTRIAKIVKQ